jgi:hypothetical protein
MISLVKGSGRKNIGFAPFGKGYLHLNVYGTGDDFRRPHSADLFVCEGKGVIERTTPGPSFILKYKQVY